MKFNAILKLAALAPLGLCANFAFADAPKTQGDKPVQIQDLTLVQEKGTIASGAHLDHHHHHHFHGHHHHFHGHHHGRRRFDSVSKGEQQRIPSPKTAG